MKNQYEFIGSETVKIWLQVKDNKQIFTMISAVHLESADIYPGTWYAHWDNRTEKHYVAMSRGKGKSRGLVLLHRVVMGVEGVDGVLVDHIDGMATLDNRISNLRLCSTSENNQNLKVRSDNSSGYRGVSYDKRRGRWFAYCTINGVYHYLGSYDSPDKAGDASANFRRNNMPFSSDSLEVIQSEQ